MRWEGSRGATPTRHTSACKRATPVHTRGGSATVRVGCQAKTGGESLNARPEPTPSLGMVEAGALGNLAPSPLPPRALSTRVPLGTEEWVCPHYSPPLQPLACLCMDPHFQGPAGGPSPGRLPKPSAIAGLAALVGCSSVQSAGGPLGRTRTSQPDPLFGAEMPPLQTGSGRIRLRLPSLRDFPPCAGTLQPRLCAKGG